MSDIKAALISIFITAVYQRQHEDSVKQGAGSYKYIVYYQMPLQQSAVFSEKPLISKVSVCLFVYLQLFFNLMYI